jgi:hypothetical protein
MRRLARKPSLWVSFLLRVAFVIVAAIAVNVAMFFVMKRGAFFMLTLVLLIAVAAVWELIRFTFHMRHRPPVLEIDRDALAYGDSVELRIVQAHPQSVAEVSVKLIGDCSKSESTDISEYRETKFARTRCYEEELLCFQPSAAIDRTVRVQLPKSPPADGMKWLIVVAFTLEHGAVVEHPYPLRVR